jgi:hypothetical protein
VTITWSIILGACFGALNGWGNALVLKKLIRMIMHEGANNVTRPLLLGGTILILFVLMFLGVFISAAFLIASAAGWTAAMVVSVIRDRLAAK